MRVVCMALALAACGPEVAKPFVVAPDNARSQGDADVGPRASGGMPAVTAVEPGEVDRSLRPELTPLCAGGAGSAPAFTAADDADALRTLTALSLDCAADKPTLHVNGQVRSADVVYGAGNLLAGWNKGTGELTIVRAGPNAALFRSLRGFVPHDAMPVAAHVNGSAIELVFPMTGMSIVADALVVRGPVDASAGKTPSETISLTALRRR